MSQIGHMFKLLFYDMGPLGPILLILLALISMWVGYRYSRPSDIKKQLQNMRKELLELPPRPTDTSGPGTATA